MVSATLDKLPMKVILIGFSVIEDSYHGPGEKLTQWGVSNDVEVRCFGFGGLHIEHFPFMLDIVSAHTAFKDAVVFVDILSSGIRYHFKPENYHIYMREIFLRLAALGCRPVFVHLYRRDVDFSDDSLTRYVDGYAAREGVPVLNLGARLDLLFSHSEILLEDYFRDTVHVTTLGGQYYVDALVDYVSSHNIPVYGRPSFSETQQLRTVPITALTTKTPALCLTRNGLPIPCVAIAEDDPLIVRFARSTYVMGIFIVFGPSSGLLLARDNDYEKELTCFDELSYYDHLSYKFIVADGIRTLSLSTLARFPTVELCKGNWRPGARINYLSHITTRQRLTSQ